MGGPYNLKRFDLHSIKPNAIVAIIGKRRSGKSVLMRDIAWHLRKELPYGIAMSPTEKANKFFGEFMPESHIHDDFDVEALEQLVARQEAIAEAIKQGRTTGLPKNKNAFVFADDCMYDKSNWRSKLIRNLFMNGRHWGIFLVFTMQYAMDILPELRENCDYIFVFRNQNVKQKENFHKQFFGMFSDKKEFIKVFDEVAVDNDFIVVDNTVKSNDIEECVYWGRAEMRPEPFRLGSKLMWKFNDELNPGELTKSAARAEGSKDGKSGHSEPGPDEPPVVAGPPTGKLRTVNKLGDETEQRRVFSGPSSSSAPAAAAPASTQVQQQLLPTPCLPAAGTSQPSQAPNSFFQSRQRPPSPFRRGKRPVEGRSVRFAPNAQTTPSETVARSDERPPSPFYAAKRRRRS